MPQRQVHFYFRICRRLFFSSSKCFCYTAIIIHGFFLVFFSLISSTLHSRAIPFTLFGFSAAKKLFIFKRKSKTIDRSLIYLVDSIYKCLQLYRADVPMFRYSIGQWLLLLLLFFVAVIVRRIRYLSSSPLTHKCS